MSTSTPKQTHTIICVDALTLRPNKFAHLGAEIEAGEKLKGKDYRYYEGHIKAIVVPHKVRTDFSKTEPGIAAAIKILRAEALDFVKNVAQIAPIEVHHKDWDLRLRSVDVCENRFWLTPIQTWAAGTLADTSE